MQILDRSSHNALSKLSYNFICTSQRNESTIYFQSNAISRILCMFFIHFLFIYAILKNHFVHPNYIHKIVDVERWY